MGSILKTNKERFAADRAKEPEVLKRYIEEVSAKDQLLLKGGEWQPGAGAMIVKAITGGIWPGFLREQISGGMEFTVDAKEDPDAVLEIMRMHADVFRLI